MTSPDGAREKLIRSRTMGKRKAFTLIELLVVIAIIALLMSILMPALSRVKKQARATACMARLRQWGLSFSLYCQDNDGNFFTGEVQGARGSVVATINGITRSWGTGSGGFWRIVMAPYVKDPVMWLCPQAVKPMPNGGIPQNGWTYVAWTTDGNIGSYGLNGWILNLKASKVVGDRTDGWGRADNGRHWGSPPAQYSNQVPVFAEGWWVDFWPLETDQPPPLESGPGDTPNSNEMNRVCVDRHDGFVNSVFCDWSVRKVGLKELWGLKWHRTYNTRGHWTKAGGVQSQDWPDWMQRFKEY
jgi:prepilin-type N-terminal cleavage/methylation domain-containing protein/prepilin-type processing-associated H-X9-DG protein